MKMILRSIRVLARSPGFSVVAILALALGLGANSAIFTMVNAIFLKPLPFAEADRLVQLTSSDQATQLDGVGFSFPRFEAVRARQQVFEQLALSAPTGFNVSAPEGAEQVQGLQVSHDFFPLLGLRPQLGRGFTQDEDRKGGAAVALLSHAYWQRRFGADPSVIGQTLHLDGQPFTIIGVMPDAAARFPLNQVAVFTARPTEVSYLVPAQVDGGGYFFNVIGRLKPGVQLREAQAQLDTIASAYAAAFPQNVDAKSQAHVDLWQNELVGNQRGTYLALFGAVGAILLLACANVTNLVLVHYAARRKQLAVRCALGAKTRHILGECLTDNLLIALAGGLLGLVLAVACLTVMKSVGAAFIPRLAEINLDAQVVLFTLGLALITGLLLGLVPVWQMRAAPLADTLRAGTRDRTVSVAQQRLHAGLLIGEIALSFVLLIVASLLIASFLRIQNVAPGFRMDGVYTAFIQVPNSSYPERSEALINFYQNLNRRLQAIPGVRQAALGDSVPLAGAGPAPYAVLGRPIPPMAEQANAIRHIVSPGYFDTLDVRIKAGRDFSESDPRSGVFGIIINETLARQAFPDENPIGRRIVTGMLQLESEIIGVVADMQSQSLTDAPVAEMYHGMTQRPEGFAALVVRTEGDPMAIGKSVRAALKELDASIALTNESTLAEIAANSISDRRLIMWLLGLFAGLAFVLASLGVYSVMAYTVRQRNGEIAVRLALGARAEDVRRMVLRHGMGLAAIGIGIGLLAALAATRLITHALFEVSAFDPLAYGGIAGLLASVAMIACWLPARRAAATDPIDALRG